MEYYGTIIDFVVQENMLCMWKFRSREGPEDERTVIEPELICKKYLSAGVTDLCFFDEQNLVASLESGGVVMFQYLNAAEVSKYLCVYCLSFSMYVFICV